MVVVLPGIPGESLGGGDEVASPQRLPHATRASREGGGSCGVLSSSRPDAGVDPLGPRPPSLAPEGELAAAFSSLEFSTSSFSDVIKETALSLSPNMVQDNMEVVEIALWLESELPKPSTLGEKLRFLEVARWLRGWAEPLPSSALRITLTGRERRALKKIVKAHKSEQRLVLRARIVQAAALGQSNSKIAEELKCDVKTVRKWRNRFATHRMEGLQDAPRSGRPAHFESTQKHEVIKLILSEPPAPFARWTLDLAVRELVRRGIVSSISRESISAWLRSAAIKPHRVKYWLNSKDPQFQEKMARVVQLYTNPPQDGQVICVDEKTGVQALERRYPDLPCRPGRVRGIEFEYIRHGTVKLLAAFEVQTGRVVGQCLKGRNNSDAFIGFLARLLREYPSGKIYLVMDNASTHCSKKTKGFLKQNPRLVPVYLPTHASWLNQIEIWFSVLSRQALRNVSFPSREALIGRILDYIQAHNRSSHPYKWTYKGQPLAA